MFKHLGAIAPMAILLACFAPQPIFAATFGSLEYIDNGTSVTISDCSYALSGNLVIPASIDGKPVTAIGDNAFSNTPLLKNVSIPSSVSRIGKSAFYLCRSLQTVNIPSGIRAIEDGAFSNCERLTSISIPSGVTSIGSFAFSYCVKLTDVAIPEAVTEIGRYAFSECPIDNLVISANVRTVGDEAFSRCKSLRTLKIRSGKTIMGTAVFWDCRKLTDVSLPSDLREISDRMFVSCSALERISIPSTVKVIGTAAFESTGLKSINLPSSLVRIEEDAFHSCDGLSMITVPSKVREIAARAFGYCSNLTSALFLGDAPVMGKMVFQSVSPDFRIYFDEGTSGYTVPTWRGHRASLPKEEIEVRTGYGAVLTHARDRRNFGSVIVGTKGVTKRFLVRNVGARKLKGLVAGIRSGNSGDFKLKVLTKSSLAPGQTAILDLTFLPKKAGKRVSELWIFSSDESERAFEIDLSGTGLKLID